jgi:hypothetical protein
MLSPDPQSFDVEEAARPLVNIRVFAIPAGLPWAQARAAQLEARHGAPLPIGELMHQVRRVGRWSPGQPARYVVFYLRVSAYRGPFETSAEIDGQTIRAGFGTSGQQVQRARRIAEAAAAGGLALVAIVAGASLALHARAAAEDRLTLADQRVAAKLHAARGLQRQADQARALKRAVGAARPVSEVIGDLAWASSARAPEAKILAVHWDHGLLGVEVRGDTPPFASTSRKVERAAKPIRTGVWLWGVHSDSETVALGPEVGP